MNGFKECKIIIPIAPVTKKNSQRILINPRSGRPFVAPSIKFKEYQENARPFVCQFGLYGGEYPVNIKCLFYMPTRRRVDLTNLLESVDDVLTHYGIITDDSSNYIGGHDGSRVFYDKDKPRTEIFIYPLKLEETREQ